MVEMQFVTDLVLNGRNLAFGDWLLHRLSCDPHIGRYFHTGNLI